MIRDISCLLWTNKFRLTSRTRPPTTITYAAWLAGDEHNCNFSFSWSITRANQGEGEGGCFFRKAIRYLYCSVDEHQSSTLYLGSRYFGNFDWTGSDVTKCSWWYFEITYFQISSRRLNWEGAWKVRIQNENWRNKMDNTAYKDWIWSGLLLKYHCFFQRHCCTPRKYLTTFRASPQMCSWREWSAALS